MRLIVKALVLLILTTVELLGQNVVLEERKLDFIEKYDSLVKGIEQMNRYEGSFDWKLIGYKRWYTYEGFELRKRSFIYHYIGDSVLKISSSIPTAELLGEKLDGKIRGYAVDKIKVDELSTISGFITQTHELNGEIVYPWQNVTFLMILDKNSATFGMIKFGRETLFLEKTSLTNTQQKIIRKLLDDYF